MNSRRPSVIVPIFMIICSMMSLTLGAALAKSLFGVVGAGPTTVLRLGMGAAFLLLLWRPWKTKISNEKLIPIFVYGACLGIMNLLFYFAIARMPLGLAIAIEFLGPLSVAIFYSRRALDFLWAALALVGVILILPLSNLQASVSLSGVAFALGAAVMWALYIVIGKKAGESGPSGVVTALGVTIGFLVVAPFGITDVAPALATSTLALTALGVGILSSAIPYSLEMVALAKLPPQHFSLLLSLEPAIGSLVGYLFIGEHLTTLQLVAVACVITASVGSTRKSNQAPT